MNMMNHREDMILMVIVADKAPRHLLQFTKITPIVSFGVCDSCVQHEIVLTGWHGKTPYRQCADCLLDEYPRPQGALMSLSWERAFRWAGQDAFASPDGMFGERASRWAGPDEDLVRSEISILAQNHLRRWGSEL